MLKPIWYCHNADHNNNPCGPFLSIAKNNDNKATVCDDHLFFPSIVLSNAINKIVVLLTAEHSNNNIQYKYTIVFIE